MANNSTLAQLQHPEIGQVFADIKTAGMGAVSTTYATIKPSGDGAVSKDLIDTNVGAANPVITKVTSVPRQS